MYRLKTMFLGSLAAAWLLTVPGAQASIYNGDGLSAGVGAAGSITGTSQGGVREVVVNILNYVLSFMALAAVIMIIIAGIRLVVSQGEDDQKEKARKTIIYTVIGLVVILLAKLIVQTAISVTMQH